MSIYEVKSYRDFVRACLDDERAAGKRGAARRLADELKCHSTYVSQVTSGKADLSVDQGMRLCAYYRLSAEQTEFFLDLLNRDRAGTREAKAHFQMRIDRRLAELADMKKRWKLDATLTAEHELKYYSTWIPQAVHLYCQLPGTHTAQSIAQALDLAVAKVEKVVADLEALGFIGRSAKGLRSLRDSVHLGKDSEFISRVHVSWRLKAVADLTMRARLPGRHYSSVVSMSEKTAREIDRMILAHIETVREIIGPSPAETLHVYNLDFYPLLADIKE